MVGKVNDLKRFWDENLVYDTFAHLHRVREAYQVTCIECVPNLVVLPTWHMMANGAAKHNYSFFINSSLLKGLMNS